MEWCLISISPITRAPPANGIQCLRFLGLRCMAQHPLVPDPMGRQVSSTAYHGKELFVVLLARVHPGRTILYSSLQQPSSGGLFLLEVMP